MAEPPVGTVTLLFTDLEGSSELSEKHGRAFEPARAEHYRLLREILARTNGFEAETAGDSLFAVFERVADAVQFAVEVQRAFAVHAWPPEIGPVRIRIGMHTGEPFTGIENGRPFYRGAATNRAARVQAAGHGGQVLLTQAAFDIVRGIAPGEVTFLSLGAHRLKGVGEETLWQACHPELPREFPPLNTLNLERHNLPVPPTPLIGREPEIAAWRALLCQPTTRLLTLVGTGGLGKTRAALQLAEHCVGEFQHGVWWSGLEDARTGDDFLAGLASALRLTPQPQPALQSQLARFLRDRQLLLVLDNVEQLADAPRVVSALLQECPGLKCLVTSRSRLGLRAEVVRELEPLPVEEAVRLFVERAAAQRAGFQLTPANTADVTELCRKLEGVPLALELAASRLVAMTPREVLRRLDQQFRLLTTTSPDLPPRQRALHGTIEWSFNLLAPVEQALFRQLSVFAGGFTLAAAEAVGDVPDVVEGVQHLRHQSLLREVPADTSEATRFTMLESIRAFAAARLAALPELAGATAQRHARHFAMRARELAEPIRCRSEERAAFAATGDEAENLRGALDFSLAQPLPVAAAELGWTLCAWLQHRGAWAEAVRRCDAVLAASTALPPALRAPLLRQRAGLHLDFHEAEPAASLAKEALALARSASLPAEEAEALNLLGLAANRAGQLEEAVELLRQAHAAFSARRDELGQAKTLNNLGFVETNRWLARQPSASAVAACEFLAGALRLHEARGDQRGLAETHTNLGVLAQEQGDLASASEHYRQALNAEVGLGSRTGVARALFNLAEAAGLRGLAADGWQLASAAHYLFGEAGSPLARHAAELKAKLGAQGSPDPDGTKETSFQGRPLPEVVQLALRVAQT